MRLGGLCFFGLLLRVFIEQLWLADCHRTTGPLAALRVRSTEWTLNYDPDGATIEAG